jgi:anti-sigma B factor antagonist
MTMLLQTQTRPKLISVQVMEDRIDAATAIQFKEKMRDIAKAGDQRMVLDLSRVQFLDSSGLGAIVAVKKLLGPDRALELSGLTATVEKVFRLTRMDSIFIIHPSLEAAVSHAASA